MNMDNNRELHNILYNNHYFLIKISEGAVLPENHPNYYDGRTDIKITKQFDNCHWDINIGSDKVEITNDIVNSLYTFVENNIEKMFKLALNQYDEGVSGVYDTLEIKYKSVYISLSVLNTSDINEQTEINNIKNQIKEILMLNNI